MLDFYNLFNEKLINLIIFNNFELHILNFFVLTKK